MPWERDVDVRVRAQHLSARRVADGNWRSLRGTRDGALVNADWLQMLIAEGRGFCAGIGLLSAGEALPATAITTLRPSLWLRVPTNVTIMPLYCGVQVEDTGATSAFEIALGVALSDVGNGTSSGADYGPSNLRANGPATRGVVARQEATGDVSADPAYDLWRIWKSEDNVTTPATAGPVNFVWNERPCPILVGPATLVLDIGSSAAPIVTAQFKWLEFDTSEIA